MIAAVAFVIGCQTHTHIVGDGAQDWTSRTERQWYILWGLVPLNDVDTSEIAGDVTDYEIKTETTFLDGVISIFTSIVTVNTGSVSVTK